MSLIYTFTHILIYSGNTEERARETKYLNGSRPSFVLSMKIHCSDKRSRQQDIKNRELWSVYDPLKINQEFKLFYQLLYSSEAAFTKKYFVSFFDGLNIPELSEQQIHLLDSPFTINEWYEAIKCMNHGKSPGLDGIPPELYLKFWDDLGSFILEMFQQAIKLGCFSRDINPAVITLLYKRGKDSTLRSSFPPLSLLIADVKLYAKVLAWRVETFLPTLVHPNPTGFVKKKICIW